MISRTSVIHSSRPARHHRDDEMAVDDEDKEEGHDDPMSIDERLGDMTNYMAELALEQSKICTDVA